MADFSRRVLLLVKGIPYGTLTSYGAVGKRLGYPSAARAVGQAVGRNPIPIVIPCHRVVRSDGTLGGFSMGLNLKEQLLALEGVRPMQTGSRNGEASLCAFTTRLREKDSASLVRR